MSRRGRNEGSIHVRKDGRWAATVELGRQRGKRKRKTFYGKTRRIVQEQLTAALKAAGDGLPLPSGKLTVATYARTWLEGIRPSIRPNTYAGYESILRVHIVPAMGDVRLASLSPSHLEQLYADLLAKGRAPRSIRAYNSCVHSMLDKAVRWGLVARNVAKLVDLPRQVHRELPMLTPAEVRALLAAASPTRLEALFTLALTTGARQGELLGLRWDRVDLESGVIEIRQALQKRNGRPQLVEPKTIRSRRNIVLAGLAIKALRRHRARQAEEALSLGATWDNHMNLVFCSEVGSPLDKDNVTKRQLRKVVEASGLSIKLRFHDLRHIAASLALGQGTPITVVSEMLGHADPATTLRVYAHAIPGAQRQAAEALDAALAV